MGYPSTTRFAQAWLPMTLEISPLKTIAYRPQVG